MLYAGRIDHFDLVQVPPITHDLSTQLLRPISCLAVCLRVLLSSTARTLGRKEQRSPPRILPDHEKVAVLQVYQLVKVSNTRPG